MAKPKRSGNKLRQLPGSRDGPGAVGDRGLPPVERRRRRLFLPRVARIFGVPAEAAEAMLSHPRGQSVRINDLSPRSGTEIAAVLDGLDADLRPLPWCPGAFEIHGDKRRVSDSALFRNGEVYIQNAASLIPALALAPRPGDRVLDLCAAPGGKAAHLAALTSNRIDLHVNDAMKPRLASMRELLATLHVDVATVTDHPAQYADKFIEGPFDRILLDAQCSGEGMVDLGHPNGLRYWGPDRIDKMARLQQRMIMAAWKLLRPGGRLVYSTCTFAPEENEGPVDHLVRHRADAGVQPVDLAVPGRRPGLTRWNGRAFHPRLRDALRVAPAPHLEGFFVCRIDKADEGA